MLLGLGTDLPWSFVSPHVLSPVERPGVATSRGHAAPSDLGYRDRFSPTSGDLVSHWLLPFTTPPSGSVCLSQPSVLALGTAVLVTASQAVLSSGAVLLGSCHWPWPGAGI